MSLASYLAAPPRGSDLRSRQVAGASLLCQGDGDALPCLAPCPSTPTVREPCDSRDPSPRRRPLSTRAVPEPEQLGAAPTLRHTVKDQTPHRMFIERKINSSTHAVELWKAEWEHREGHPRKVLIEKIGDEQPLLP